MNVEPDGGDGIVADLVEDGPEIHGLTVEDSDARYLGPTGRHPVAGHRALTRSGRRCQRPEWSYLIPSEPRPRRAAHDGVKGRGFERGESVREHPDGLLVGGCGPGKSDRPHHSLGSET